MKRGTSLTIFVILALLMYGIAPGRIQATELEPIRLFVNGEMITPDVEPVILDDRTMVPLRVVADHLGRHVLWDGDNRRVIISRSTEGYNPLPSRALSNNSIIIMVDGKEIDSDVPPFIWEGRTMVPIRLIAEGLGMQVAWDPLLRQICIDEPAAAPTGPVVLPEINELEKIEVIDNVNRVDPNTTILGVSQASAAQMKAILLTKNPGASTEIVDLYLEIGSQYGLRGDIAFCQAAKETGWWLFKGSVQAFQNNYCGLGATGVAATGTEDLKGADPARVSYQTGIHGAVFATPADGVEAHIQHLYAYACKGPLPAGKILVDPRFTRPVRGCTALWVDLGGKWAVPGYDRSYASFEEAFAAGKTYGQSILNDYYALFYAGTE